MQKRALWIAMGFGLFVLFYERGAGPLTSLTFLAIVITGIPAFFLAAALRPGRLLSWARGLLLFLGIQVLFVPFGGYLRRTDLARARAYCMDVIALLESHKADEGSYPATVDATLPPGDPPRFVRLPSLYRETSDGYELSFAVPGVLFPHLHRYQSSTGRWELLD